jgi:ribonuclease E
MQSMKRMLINATQAEERRLAIVDGQKLLDYEIEIEGREQRKGNIYKAVVTRVEPSLEACFVDYGEDRHGFLPFKEISKMYFREGVSASQARIQDVIKEGQELLVQVEKEERGNKGAALTTFVSLAGRYVVLMPNNPRGGGVSRRIEGEDRAELKENMDQLEYPNGMSIIARTAGIGRSAPELQWDLNYLLKLWTAIDGAARGGKGAFLIYQESSLVIRAIRDYFNHDIGDILIDTDDVYDQAQQFMAHVMPEHAARVKRYRDDAPLFSRFQIEHQIESAYARTVTLPSGGAIVIDHTEALVSVDVNSARAIKGGDIEETATRTNLEAADEVARQMRLRDLGGLIVIDFIDMEESRNRREVENRLRDALRQDRARVQFGTISKFGLMEMSRQRLRPALSEGASIPCPRCGGAGHIRDTESSALQILRIIQEESLKDSTASVMCQVPVDVASFLLNEKRSEVAKIELKQRINVLLVPNKTLETPNYRLERLKHDDPRLDNIEASYKMADEIEDPTSVTRRSQEPTNKQTPLIKGVLPDAPAPIAPPKPEVSKPVAAAPVVRVAPAAPAPASAGFFGWIKNLFAGEPEAPIAKPVAAPSARPEDKREGRDGGRGGREGNRNGGRNEGRGPRGEGRAQNGEARPDGARPEGRDGRGEGRGRGGRGRGQGGDRQAGAQRERFDAEGKPQNMEMGMQAGPLEGQQEQRPERGQRGERNEPRSDRGERGPRQGRGSDRSENTERNAEPRAEGQDELRADNQSDQFPDANGQAREPREGRGNRGGRGGRGRRDERGPRQDDGMQAPSAEGQQASLGFASADSSSASTPAEGGSAQAETENGESREKRSRDRYGRERGHRRERTEQDGERNEAAPVAADVVTSVPAPSAPAPVAVAPQASATHAVAEKAMPKVSSYALPTETLQQVAQTSGLQWVNSDPTRIAAVQAAIAAEPQPARVPRERPAPVAIHEGPLVLVETKKDLRNMTLPFEEAPTA